MPKQKILFLCTGNSCRSQMGEAWCRALKSDRYEANSAGTIAKGLNPTHPLWPHAQLDPLYARANGSKRMSPGDQFMR